MLEQFRLAIFELILKAGSQGLDLPRYKGSTIRGGFGSAFRRICCSFGKEDCKGCMLATSCPYAYIFETSPPPGAQALRNYENIPRPFVLEPPLDEKSNFKPGEELIFNLVLMGRAIDYLPYFLVAFQELGRLGIGRGRKQFTLQGVEAVNPLTGQRQKTYDAEQNRVYITEMVISGEELEKALLPVVPSKVILDFETMTRLKFDGHLAFPVEFHILIRSLLRRISSLYLFHHGREWKVDFSGLIKYAENVRRINDESRWVDWERYSNRQQTKMNLGGAMGTVTYEGDLKPFLPLLQLGELVHVGKACTFGMGKYRIS